MSEVERGRDRGGRTRRILAPLIVIAVLAASVAMASPASATFISGPTTAIEITGVARVDQTLTIQANPNGYVPAAETFTFQWFYENGTAISGATDQTYTPTVDDIGEALYAEVSAHRAAGSLYVSATVIVGVVGPGAFTLDSAPSLPSPAWVGAPVAVTPPTLTPDPETTEYAWFYADGTPVPGAGSGSSYTPVLADVGRQLYVESTSVRDGYQNYVVGSNLTGAVALNGFDAPDAPSVVGSGIVGTPFAVEVHLDSWDPEPESFSYRWFAASSDDPLGEAISGATGAEFTPDRELIGQYVYLEVTGHRTGYADYVVGSGRSAVVFDVFSFELGASSAAPGSEVDVDATGLEPDTEYALELHSDPVALTTVTTDGYGAFSTSVTIPVDTEVGEHEIVLLLDEEEVASATITVGAPDGDDSPAGTVPSTGARALPSTGTAINLWSAVLASLLLLSGAGALSARRGLRGD